MGIADPGSIILFLILYLHFNQDVVLFFLRRFGKHQDTNAEHKQNYQYQKQIHVTSLLSRDQRLTELEHGPFVQHCIKAALIPDRKIYHFSHTGKRSHAIFLVERFLLKDSTRMFTRKLVCVTFPL